MADLRILKNQSPQNLKKSKNGNFRKIEDDFTNACLYK
jgi:hypothetical protein